MKQCINYILTIGVLLSTISCSLEELQTPTLNPGSDKVTVVGRVTNFADYNVTTKDTKDDKEGYIDIVTMAIFPVSDDGKALAGDGKCVYYTPNQTSTSFTFDRSGFTPGARYAIYVFANVEMPTFDNEEGYKSLTLDELLEYSFNVTGVDIPEAGFPMIGTLGDTFSDNPDRDNKVFIMRPSTTGNDEPAPTVDGESMSLLQIPMDALFAKINFTIEVDADQTIQGNSPQFTLTNFSIGNVFKKVSFEKSLNNFDLTTYDDFKEVFSEPFTGTPSNGNVAVDDGSIIEFTFYVPERLISPTTSASAYPYPFRRDDGTIRVEDESLRQRFKPRLIGDKPATHVVLTGRYRDHQNHYYDVSYTIYLGSDNYGNFDIVRNGEYNNTIVIKGLTNSSDSPNDGGTISVDHRVNLTRSQPAIIELRREVLLDSHFEVRPLRIRSSGIDDEGVDAITHVQVEILDAGEWMSLERSFGDGTLDSDTPKNGKGEYIYIDDENSASYGKRRYFTHNLITGTDAGDHDHPLTGEGSKKVVVPITDAGECVWIYVDECTERGDDIRSGTIKITYGSGDGVTTPFDATEDSSYPPINYAINQRKLFHVVNGEYKYDIEYHEEYLYNYDANDSFGQTDFEGMPWGLDGAQLSFDKKAVVFNSGDGWVSNIVDLIVNSEINNVSPYYDFYIDKYDTDIMPTASNRSNRDGYMFCQEIINDINTKNNDKRDTGYEGYINVRDMATQPKSAIEYCYNKNKRNADGEVVWQDGEEWNTDNLRWYLPAVDEIEDIVMSTYLNATGNVSWTYGRFLEFQDKYYWSCQPAYTSNLSHYLGDYSIWTLDEEGYIYMDHVLSARATKVVSVDGVFSNITSGASGYENVVFFNRSNSPVIYNLREKMGESNAWSYSYTGTYLGIFQREFTKSFNRNDLMQTDEGHQPRTKHNRIRCVRYSEDNATD